MKPPPRQRLLTNRYDVARPECEERKAERKPERRGRRLNVCNWMLGEQRRLLKGLEWLTRRRLRVRVEAPLDYEAVRRRVPKRSVEEVRAVVLALQARAVSRAAGQLLWQRRQEAELGGGGEEEEEPLQLWREAARYVAGDLEEVVATAFSQMLVVSSTEPQTLCNSAVSPPRSGPAHPTTTGPAHPTTTGPAHPTTTTGLVTPGPLPPRGLSPGGSPPPVLQTPASGPPSGPPVGALVPPSMPEQGPSATPSLASPGAGCQATASPSVMPWPSQVLGVSGATDEPGSRVQPVEGPGDAGLREQRSKFSVDFQKIYLHLSNACRESEDSPLSPMECAVVLDLLMALPEELPLLDGGKLRQHMIETYASLSAPVPPPAPPAERDEDPTRPGTADAEPARDAGDSAAAAGEHNGSDDHGELVVPPRRPAPPPCPLNPFTVPLKLLVKRS